MLTQSSVNKLKKLFKKGEVLACYITADLNVNSGLVNYYSIWLNYRDSELGNNSGNGDTPDKAVRDLEKNINK